MRRIWTLFTRLDSLNCEGIKSDAKRCIQVFQTNGNAAAKSVAYILYYFCSSGVCLIFRRVIEAIDKMVEQHNIMFFTSAGNLGPALSTLNCPGAVTRNVIGGCCY